MSDKRESYEYGAGRQYAGGSSIYIRNEFLYKSVEDLKREALGKDHASLTIPEAESLLRLRASESRDNSVERRLIALEQRPVCQHTADPSREYYEHQIEELSAKWQAAQEKLSEMRTLHSLEANRSDRLFLENKEQADTISELRETIGKRDAIIAEKNRELQEAEKNYLRMKQNYSMHIDVISDLRDQLAAKSDALSGYEVTVKQLEAMIAEKNRDLQSCWEKVAKRGKP